MKSNKEEHYEKQFRNYDIVSSLKDNEIHVSAEADVACACTKTCTDEAGKNFGLEINSLLLMKER